MIQLPSGNKPLSNIQVQLSRIFEFVPSRTLAALACAKYCVAKLNRLVSFDSRVRIVVIWDTSNAFEAIEGTDKPRQEVAIYPRSRPSNEAGCQGDCQS
jgi:hypothetical protein